MCDNNTRIITSRRRKKKMIAGPEIWEIRQMYLLVRIIVCTYIYIIFYIYHYSFGIIVCPRIRSFLMRRRWWSSAPGHFLCWRNGGCCSSTGLWRESCKMVVSTGPETPITRRLYINVYIYTRIGHTSFDNVYNKNNIHVLFLCVSKSFFFSFFQEYNWNSI